ncbi:DUF302 domain-containing protein [Myxococcota bacterium]|nr:DUF302 domain-containing protein [Myxococcota bacterium]
MYGFTIRIPGAFEVVVARVPEELKREGFGVLADIDVQATLKAKLGVKRLPYRNLGACNRPLAHRAIEAEPDIGLFLPCNVIVPREKDGRNVMGFMEPAAVLAPAERPELETVGTEVRARPLRVRDTLARA